MGYDIAKIRQFIQSQSGKGQKYFYPVDGENRVRFLQGPPGNEEMFFIETLKIRINGNDYFSPKMKGEFCPIRNFVSKAYDSEDAELIAKAKQIKPTKSFMTNVIVRELKDKSGKVIGHNVGPKIFCFGVKIKEKIDSVIMNSEEFPDFLHPINGNDFKIIRKKVDEYPNYDSSVPVYKSCPIHESQEEIDRILANLHDLRAEITYPEPGVLERELDIFLSGGIKSTYQVPTTITSLPPVTAPAATVFAAPAAAVAAAAPVAAAPVAAVAAPVAAPVAAAVAAPAVSVMTTEEEDFLTKLKNLTPK